MGQRAASAAIAAVLVFVGATAGSHAFQTPSTPTFTPATLQGTWVYVSSSPAAREDKRFAGRRIRLYTTQGWFVAQVDPQNGRASFLYGGHYELSGSTITEIVDYASMAASVMLNTRATFTIKSEKDTMTLSGKHELTNPADGAFDENWQRHPETAGNREPGTLTTQEVADIMLLQAALSAPVQDLAASFLGNHNRLEMLALYSKGQMGNANIFFGAEQVTASNASQLTSRYQHRQDVYSDELRRRGTPKVEGRYTLTESAPCPSTPADAVDVDLKQDGFEIKMMKAGSLTDKLLSGVVADRVLTMGDGDFDPDQYVFGAIGPASILLKPFSGQGCGISLTRK